MRLETTLRRMNSLRSKSFSSTTSRTAADEQLAMGGLDRLDPLAEIGVVDGNVAPADQRLAFLGNHLLDDLFDLGARLERSRGMKNWPIA